MDIQTYVHTDGWTFETSFIRSTLIVDLKADHKTLTTPIRGSFFIARLTLDIAYLCIKFDDSSFSSSRCMTGAPKI